MISKNLHKICFCMIGNPGTGKSTFLNGLIGEAKFFSGASLDGTGVTSALQMRHDAIGNVYIDTPGLADIKMRELAAAEIEKALKQEGLYKVMFVITLEGGRIRPDDKVTIKLVLEAAPIGSKYSIIINKVNENWFEKMSRKKQEFLLNLNEGLPHPCVSVYFYFLDNSLDYEENAIPTLTPNFYEFLSSAPLIYVNPTDVKKVNSDQWAAERKKMEEAMEAQHKKFGDLLNAQEQKSKEMKEQLEQELAKQAKRLIEIQNENMNFIQNLQSEHKKQMQEMTKKEKSQEKESGGFWRAVATVVSFGLLD